jgi:hypothetical protein
MRGKEGAKFVTIISIIGAILIALGIAWEISQNWHYFNAPLKISILAFFTLASFGIAVFLGQKKMERIAKSLYVLGNLLYILSVFQIAQIFNLGTTAQTYSWIFLICLAGVAFTSYYFKSYTSMLISFVLFLIWLTVQFIALDIRLGIQSAAIALYAFLILSAGLFFYGLSLIHRAFGHAFARLYQIWSVIYFLLMAYIISFQAILPYYWQGNFSFGSKAVFVTVTAILSILFFAFGLSISTKRKKIKIYERRGIIITAVALAALIFLTKAAQIDTGACTLRQCYQYQNAAECNAQKDIECFWTGNQFAIGAFGPSGYCEQKNCYFFNNSATCVNESGCQWQGIDAQTPKGDGYCTMNCSLINKQTDCQKTTISLKGCAWINNTCRENYGITENYCSFDSQQACAKDTKCNWDKTVSTLDQRYMQRNHPISQTVWIAINLALLVFIIAIILFGSLTGDAIIVNLGIILFIINIITRYIGFIIDLKWYNNLALLFISGGIVIILGGLLVERWRRSLITRIQKSQKKK